MLVADADPLDAAQDLPPTGVLDRVKEQVVIGGCGRRIGAYRHNEAATMLEVNGGAPTDGDHVRRLAPEAFGAL